MDKDSGLTEVSSLTSEFNTHKIALIHSGYPEGDALSSKLKSKGIAINTNIFVNDFCGKLYTKHLAGTSKFSVLIHDGFRKSKNADYPDNEPFSELHLIYKDEGFSGFGDFLMVGDDYSETGGPAYAVAIHITYFRKDKVLFIRHFKSDRTDSPVDPAGKFLEALEKLVEAVKAEETQIYKTKAIHEFIEFHNKGHFPGLGYVKKLSMQHHLELMLKFLK
jgi:hypothetical protein